MPMLSWITGSERLDSELSGLLLEHTANGAHQYRRSGVLKLYGLDKEALLFLSDSHKLSLLNSDHSKSEDTSIFRTIKII